MKTEAINEGCLVIGPFIDDALEQSTEAPTRGRSRNTTTKKPKTTVNRQKKPGVASNQAQRRPRKKGR